LLGKEPQMAKRRQARREGDFPGGTAVAQYPALRQRARAAPMTRILLSPGLEDRIGREPLPVTERRPPHRLRLGTAHPVGPVSFELAPGSAIEESVVLPPLGDEKAAGG